MQKTLVLLLPLIVLLSFSSKEKKEGTKNEIEFFKGSWNEAVVKAKKEKKPIFLDIYATWCGPCKLLKKETFTNKSVAAYFNANYINVSLDGEKGEGEMLAQKYQIPGFPTLIILNKEAVPVHATAGFMPPAEFLQFGRDGFSKANY